MPAFSSRSIGRPALDFKVRSESHNGFVVDTPAEPIRVTLCDTGFHVRPESQCARTKDGMLLGLCDLSGLVRRIAGVFRISRGVIAELNSQRVRLLRRADPTVLAIQKAVFAATLQSNNCRMLHNNSIYRDRYFVRDVCRMPAAASAVILAESLYVPARHVSDRIPYSLSATGDRLYCRPLFPEMEPIPGQGAVMALIGDWMSLFSLPGERPNKSLRRTLSSMKPIGRAWLLLGLPDINLETPRLGLELQALLLSIADHRSRCDGRRVSAERIFMWASGEEIRRSLGQISRSLRCRLSHRKVEHVGQLVSLVSNHLQEHSHSGRLPKLVERALVWERTLQKRAIRSTLSSLGVRTPTAAPPLPLPTARRVAFRHLATVGEVVAEAEHSAHCVSAYARDAVEGRCYILRAVGEDGQTATALVWSHTGHLEDFVGPANQTNSTSKNREARRALLRWGRQLRRHAPRASDSGFAF